MLRLPAFGMRSAKAGAMKPFQGRTDSKFLRNLGNAKSVVAAVVFAVGIQSSITASPAPAAKRLQGIYQIVSSSDPIFPTQDQQEWFLDFGQGPDDGKNLSGTVAVSLRRNPHVRVKIMVWQYFPKEESLVIGSPYHEKSRQAVAAGTWQVQPGQAELRLQRDGCRIILRRTVSP
jgi:hypothetical protein